jgi:hypothetical protein
VSAVEHRIEEPLLLVKNENHIIQKMESGEKACAKVHLPVEEVKGLIEDEEPPMRDKSGGDPKLSSNAIYIPDRNMLSLHSSQSRPEIVEELVPFTVLIPTYSQVASEGEDI